MSVAPDYDDQDYDYDDEDDCSMCGGEGEQECHDFIQCMGRHSTFKTPDGFVVHYCACIACGGSGAARDQRIW